MDYQRQIKKVKSLIRGYDAADLLEALYRYMNADGEDNVDRLRRLPWLVMLIIKWNCLENRVHPEFAKRLTNDSFNKILKTAYKLNEYVKMPNEVNHYRNFIRNIAFQQFIYQKEISGTTIASNNILFADLPSNHRFHKRFIELTGVQIGVFNKCCYLIYAAFTKGNSVSIDDFYQVFECVGRDNLQRTLDILSIELHKVKGKVRENDCSNGSYSEWYEQTPFLRFPLIKHDGKYKCLNIFVFFRCIEGFVYDLLKNDNSQSFMAGFGKVFEDYLNKGLKYSGCHYIDENTLRSEVPQNVNLVDFIVSNKNCNVFIDAKGVELPYLGKVSDNPKVILGKVKTSALKAIKQAYVLNNYMLKNSVNSVQYKSVSYLVVVTYKELYLGTGRIFYESIAREAIDEITGGIDDSAVIPLENIYFITLEEFDLLCSVVNRTNLSIEDILVHSKKSDLDPEMKKFDFSQHIQSLGVDITRPEYLDASLKQITEMKLLNIRNMNY